MYHLTCKKRSTGLLGPFLRLLTGAVLLALLAACGTNPTIRTEYVREKPPVALISDCPVPVMQASTNSEIATTLLTYVGALRGCNQDKADLRKWVGE